MNSQGFQAQLRGLEALVLERAAPPKRQKPPTFRCGICGEEKSVKQMATSGPLLGPQCQPCFFAKVDGAL